MLQKLCRVTFFLLVATALIFPSEGSRGVLNPKALAFLLFVPSFFLWLLSERKVIQADFLPLSGLCFVLFGLCVWVGVAYLRGVQHPDSLLDQVKIFLITFIPFFGGLVIAKRGVFSFPSFIRTLIFSNIFYSLIKLGLLILLFLKVISIKTFLEVTGIRLMSMNVADSFERLLTSCDVFTPFLLFFAMARNVFGISLSKKFVWWYVPLSLLSIAVGFSRAFLFVGAMALMLGLLLEAQKKLVVAFYVMMLAGTATVFVVGPERIANMIELRFLSSENSASDDTRKVQIAALGEEIEQYPLFGIGIGGYSEKVIRDLDIRHLYEVQWVSLLAQLGWLGIFPLCGSIFALFFAFLLPPFSFPRLFLFFLYLFWLMSGFTNPFVLSLASGVMYTLFALGYHETSHLHPTRKIALEALS